MQIKRIIEVDFQIDKLVVQVSDYIIETMLDTRFWDDRKIFKYPDLSTNKQASR